MESKAAGFVHWLGLAVILIASVIPGCGGGARPIPCERAIDIWGVEHDLSSKEWILFDFTHSAGCGYCVLNAHAYQENFGDGLSPAGVQTYGVDIFEDQRDLVDYITHHRIRFPVLTEPDELWQACPGIPGQALFHNGRRVYAESELRTVRAYEQIREKLAAAGVRQPIRPFRPAGPLKKALGSVYEDSEALVVVGDDAPSDPEQIIPGLRNRSFEVKRAREVSEEDLQTRTLLFIGPSGDHPLIDRLEGKIPFELRDGAVRIADSLFTGEDLFLWTCFPNPWNRERYLVLRVGSGDVAQGHFDSAQDFVLSRRIVDPDTGSPSYQVLARGIFEKRDGNWSLPASEIVWGESETEQVAEFVMQCGSEGCLVPTAASTSAPAPHLNSRGSGSVEALPHVLETHRRTLGPGRFPAIACGEDSICWVAWDRPGFGISVGRMEGDRCDMRRIGTQGEHASEAYKPAVCPDGAGGCWIAWNEEYEGYFQIFASNYRGEEDPTVWRVSNAPNLDHAGPSITRGTDDTVLLTWNSWRANSRHPSHRIFDGETWSAIGSGPQADPGWFAWYHSGAPTQDGAIQVSWMQHYPALPTGIYAASLDSGQWSEPVEISDAGRSPSIAASPCADETWAVWQEYAYSSTGGKSLDWTIRYAQKLGEDWSQALTIPGCPAGRNESPVVTIDGEGRIWVAWSHKDRPRGGVGGTWELLYAFHDGSGWNGPFVLTDPAFDARSPAIASAATLVWIAWHQGAGERMEIAVARLRGAYGEQSLVPPAQTATKTAKSSGETVPSLL